MTTVETDPTITVGYHPTSSSYSVEHRPGGPLRRGLTRGAAIDLAARLGAPPDDACHLAARARHADPTQVGRERFATIRLCAVCDKPTCGHNHTDCSF